MPTSSPSNSPTRRTSPPWASSIRSSTWRARSSSDNPPDAVQNEQNKVWGDLKALKAIALGDSDRFSAGEDGRRAAVLACGLCAPVASALSSMTTMLVAPVVALVTLELLDPERLRHRPHLHARQLLEARSSRRRSRQCGWAYLSRSQYPVPAILLLKSLVMSLVATIVVILMAYPMAYFLAFRVTRHKALWMILSPSPSGRAIFCASSPGKSCSATMAPSTPA